VTDAVNGKPLAPVVVVNLRTQQSVYTEDDGHFVLPAQNGDQVAFTFIGYKTLQWKMPPSIGQVQQDFKMEVTSYMLKEYVVRTKNYTQYQIDSLQRKSTYQRTLAREKGGSIMSPVTFVAEKISHKSKQIEKFQKEFYYWEDQRFIDSRYTPDLVNALTNLTGDTLAHFMNTYPMPYDYARAASDLEVKMWIRTNFKEWMHKQQLDSTQKEIVAQPVKN
jgi:hypothetical protein